MIFFFFFYEMEYFRKMQEKISSFVFYLGLWNYLHFM